MADIFHQLSKESFFSGLCLSKPESLFGFAKLQCPLKYDLEAVWSEEVILDVTKVSAIATTAVAALEAGAKPVFVVVTKTCPPAILPDATFTLQVQLLILIWFWLRW